MNKSEKFWDRLAKNYDMGSKKDKRGHIKAVERIKKHLNESDSVLDYGCATGTLALDLADSVNAIHGIDISAKMINAAKRKAGERKIENIDFAQSTLFDAKHKEESFNVILAFNVLHLLEDTRSVVRRINELLVPGGLFISTTVCLGDRKSLISIGLSLLEKLGIAPYIECFKISELEDLVASQGFQILETEKTSSGPSNLFIVARKL